MFPVVIAVVLVVNEATVSSVNGEGCSSVNTASRPVINMCEAGSWRLGVVYISVTPTNMGSSTSCRCTMSGQVQGQDVTTNFQLKHVDLTIPNCVQTVLTVRRPGASKDFSCVTTTTLVTFDSTENITITLSRQPISSGTSLCLSIIPVNHAENDILLTCGGRTQTSTASPTSPDTAATPSTSMSAMSSSPSSTSEVSTLALNTVAPSTAIAASTVEMKSSTAEMTSNTEPSLTGKRDQEPKDNKTDLVPLIVGGAVGGSILIAIVIVLIVVCKRRKPTSSPAAEALDSAYTSLSDVTRVNIRDDPNYVTLQSERGAAQPARGVPEGSGGVYETVE